MLTHINKTSNNIWLIFLLIIFLGIAAPHIYAKDTCVDCHKDAKFLIQNKKLFDYYKTWQDSAHDVAGVKCFDCHGGDPTKTDKDEAHKSHFSSFLSDDSESIKFIPLQCGKCHEEVLMNFMTSKHYKVIKNKKGEGPNCITCHGSMNVGIYEASEIGKSCEVCHNDKTKNSPEMGKVAERVLNNVNILRIYKEWLSSHNVYFDEIKQKKIIADYQDIVFSWHTFNFSQIEARVREPLNESRDLIKGVLADTKRKKYQQNKVRSN